MPYYDLDGNVVNLETLCRREPLWAMTRLRVLYSMARIILQTLDSKAPNAEKIIRDIIAKEVPAEELRLTRQGD